MKPEQEVTSRSEMLDYVLSMQLPFILRNGMTLLFLVIVVACGLLYFIKVPDTIEGRSTLTSDTPPIPLVPKTNGKITSLLAQDKDSVNKGTLLAMVENISNPKQVMALESFLSEMRNKIEFDSLDYLSTIPAGAFNELGELQNSYETFKKANNELCITLARGQFALQKAILRSRVNSLANLRVTVKKQKELATTELRLARENFTTDSILAVDRNISLVQLRASESMKLRAEQALNTASQAIINNENSLNDLREQEIALEKNFEQQKNSFLLGFQGLNVALKEWKNRYLITSPIDGGVSFHKHVYEGLYVQTGEPIFYVLPEGSAIICEMMVQQENFGKLKHGQKAIIKLDGYKFEEYGVVEGVVDNISDVPHISSQGVDTYLVQIRLTNDLKTSFGFDINARYGLSGTASIIISDRSLLEKLFIDRIKALFIYQ